LVWIEEGRREDSPKGRDGTYWAEKAFLLMSIWRGLAALKALWTLAFAVFIGRRGVWRIIKW
jgi:hypothetical protein